MQNFIATYLNLEQQYDQLSLQYTSIPFIDEYLDMNMNILHAKTMNCLKNAYKDELTLEYLGKKIFTAQEFDLISNELICLQNKNMYHDKYNNNKDDFNYFIDSYINGVVNDTRHSTNTHLENLHINKMKANTYSSAKFTNSEYRNKESILSEDNMLSLNENNQTSRKLFDIKKKEKNETTQNDLASIKESVISSKNIRADSIRKRMKTIFNNYIVDKMNSFLRVMEGNVFIFKLPKNYSTNLNKKFNQEILSMTVKEVFLADPINQSDLKRVEHNKAIINRPDTPQEFKEFLEIKMSDVYNMYLSSPEYETTMNSFMKNNGVVYTSRFKRISSKFIEHFQFM
jgi:hypothetical protein